MAMSDLRIEMNRGSGWETRQEGTVEITREQAIAYLVQFAYSHHAHRVVLDGEVIATHQPK